MTDTQSYLRLYARERPFFLSVLRAKEASLYQQFLPLRHPILDVGCGDGFFARVTFGKRKIDVGLDMGDSRISQAKKSDAYKSVVTYDGYTIPFPNRSFQTVVINSVLEHVDDLPRIIDEAHRVLVPGGTCLTTVMAAPWEQYLFGTKVLGDWYRRWMRKKQVHVNLLSSAEWSAAFRRSGFRVATVLPYLSANAGALLDVLHYVSLPNLLSYAAVKKWVVFPQITHWYPHRFLSSFMDESVPLADAGALFYVLKRT